MNKSKEMKNNCNLGYIFYKKYYNLAPFQSSQNFKLKEFEFKRISEMNSQLLEFKFNDSFVVKFSNKTFNLKTTYPGLLIGSGYSHETGSDEEFKIGFYFDYTTGLPMISGSSIKGVLKYAFQNYDYIKELLTLEKICEKNLESIKNNIFDGFDENNKLLTMYDRDIFYDAVIKQTKNSLLSEDYITPHKENPLKNPIPIKFLKISPDVEFEFHFKLNDFKINDTVILSSVQKKEIFKNIILDLGLGAKTNLGYGQFEKI